MCTLPCRATVQGDFFLERTMIDAAISLLHRNEAHFIDPHTFAPERCTRAEAKKCWFPFSTGPSTCVGQRFAYVMLSLLAARMVYRYNMRLSPEAPCCGRKAEGRKCRERDFGSWIGLKVGGPVVQFRRRV